MIILDKRQLIGLPSYEVKKHLVSIESSRLHLAVNKSMYGQSLKDGVVMDPTSLEIPKNFYVPKQFRLQAKGLISILNSRIDEIKRG